jgi:hypothetical protein
MNKDNMNTGVQILLERMDTNPEEFEDDFALGGGKWYDIVQAVHVRKDKNEKTLPFLNDAEINALYEKLEDVRRENFTATVLRRLANTPKEQTQDDLFDSAKYTLATNSLTTTGTTGTWGKSSISLAQTLLLGEKQKEEIVKALGEYRTEENKKAIPR